MITKDTSPAPFSTTAPKNVQAAIVADVRRRERKSGCCWGTIAGLADRLRLPLSTIIESANVLIAAHQLFHCNLDSGTGADIPAEVRLFFTRMPSRREVRTATRLTMLFTAEPPKSPACPGYTAAGLPDAYFRDSFTTWKLGGSLIA